VSMILADLDGFAEVNERCGYAVGDRVLQAFAGLLHESCRTGDTVARLEAEAFLLLLPVTKLDAAWSWPNGSAAAPPPSAPPSAPTAPSSPPPSASPSTAPPDAWRDLLDRGEAALARAKRAGRNRCEVA
jgi:diguanylate cyclase